jgi:hypothetical protein
MILYALIASTGFGALYLETAYAHSQSLTTAVAIAAFAAVAFAIAFLVPPKLFKADNSEAAPIVLSKLMARGGVSAALVLAVNVGVWLLLGPGQVSLIEELYVYVLTALLLFHGFGGVVASHVVYLQATKQYNSNQLAAVLLMITLLLFVLVLYFVAFDWAIARDAYIHVRDLTLLTLVLLGYGRAVYAMAHH